MHRRVALLPLRGDHRHAALEAQQRHNVLLMLRALLAAYAVPPSSELRAACGASSGCGRTPRRLRATALRSRPYRPFRTISRCTIGLTPILNAINTPFMQPFRRLNTSRRLCFWRPLPYQPATRWTTSAITSGQRQRRHRCIISVCGVGRSRLGTRRMSPRVVILPPLDDLRCSR